MKLRPHFVIAIITCVVMTVLGAPVWAITMTMGIFFFTGDGR